MASRAGVSAAHMLKWAGLLAGPLLALVTYKALPDISTGADGNIVELGHQGRATAAVAVWMAIWWMTEAVHVAVTSLLVIALFPLFGARTISEAASGFGHKLLFLFMGGFILSLAMQKWNLHKRFALLVLRVMGTRTDFILAGFMGSTAFLSMWFMNTSTTIMMIPVAMSIIQLAHQREAKRGSKESSDVSHFGVVLMLGIAYSASIGGLGTPIGTAPNALVLGYLGDNIGLEIGFLDWMKIGVPIVFVFVPITWFLLSKVIFPIKMREIRGGDVLIKREYDKLGPMSRGEWIVMVIASLTVFGWVIHKYWKTHVILGIGPFPQLDASGIAIMASIALFVVPVNIRKREFAMDWPTAMKLPWDTLVLFGGGLSLASAIQDNNVGAFLGTKVAGLAGMPEWIIVLIVITLIVFLTELTSNTATTATMVPILGGIAVGLGIAVPQLVIPAALAASFAFMMPIATPPNAIVFGTGQIKMGQMVKAGFMLNIAGIILLTTMTYFLILPILKAL